MSVNTIVPDSVFPNLLSFSADASKLFGKGKNQPSIRAKSHRCSRWNSSAAPSLIHSITFTGKRGGVW